MLLLLFFLKFSCLEIYLLNSHNVYLKNCSRKTQDNLIKIENCVDQPPLNFQIENYKQYLAFFEVGLKDEIGKSKGGEAVLVPRGDKNPTWYILQLVDLDVFLVTLQSQCLTYNNSTNEFSFETCEYTDSQKFQFKNLKNPHRPNKDYKTDRMFVSPIHNGDEDNFTQEDFY
ncbi:hypothetical protein NGRA_3514 [Nosema granulosis]|uniref:Ricin B lectin domain-containing protein n=1 Tax=Nosema granulosis TaxID=83296 RepID=A0A9P6GVC1_9MICR|nr:hypothetical protein NGRA_3514 [Nosema granulosis]